MPFSKKSTVVSSIITGKYKGCVIVAPSLIKEKIYVTRGNDFRSQKLRVRYDLGYVILVFPAVGWLIHGIVYLTGLFLLIPLTHLKLGWINFGTVKTLYNDFRAQLQGTGSRSGVV